MDQGKNAAVRISAVDWARIERSAAKQRITPEEWITEAIHEWLIKTAIMPLELASPRPVKEGTFPPLPRNYKSPILNALPDHLKPHVPPEVKEKEEEEEITEEIAMRRKMEEENILYSASDDG